MKNSSTNILQQSKQTKFVSAQIKKNQVIVSLFNDFIKVSIFNLITKNQHQGVYKFQDFSETVRVNYEKLQNIYSELQIILNQKDQELSLKNQNNERVIITENGDFIFKYGVFKFGKLDFRPEVLKTKSIGKRAKNQFVNNQIQSLKKENLQLKNNLSQIIKRLETIQTQNKIQIQSQKVKEIKIERIFEQVTKQKKEMTQQVLKIRSELQKKMEEINNTTKLNEKKFNMNLMNYDESFSKKFNQFNQIKQTQKQEMSQIKQKQKQEISQFKQKQKQEMSQFKQKQKQEMSNFYNNFNDRINKVQNTSIYIKTLTTKTVSDSLQKQINFIKQTITEQKKQIQQLIFKIQECNKNIAKTMVLNENNKKIINQNQKQIQKEPVTIFSNTIKFSQNFNQQNNKEMNLSTNLSNQNYKIANQTYQGSLKADGYFSKTHPHFNKFSIVKKNIITLEYGTFLTPFYHINSPVKISDTFSTFAYKVIRTTNNCIVYGIGSNELKNGLSNQHKNQEFIGYYGWNNGFIFDQKARNLQINTGTITTNDTIRIVVNLKAREISWFKNGNKNKLYTSQISSKLASKDLYPVLIMCDNEDTVQMTQ